MSYKFNQQLLIHYMFKQQGETQQILQQTLQKVEILELEKLKLIEQIEYESQKQESLTQEYNDELLQREQEYQQLLNKLSELEKINSDLAAKQLSWKRNEEQLNTANYHFTILQKKVDALQDENSQLTQKITQLTNQNQQLQIKWQKCSSQLKGSTNLKSKLKETENSNDKILSDLASFKEKYVNAALELNIIKESEAEYKNCVKNKISQLCAQLQQAEDQIIQLQQQSSTNKHDCENCVKFQKELNQLQSMLEDYEYQLQEKINYDDQVIDILKYILRIINFRQNYLKQCEKQNYQIRRIINYKRVLINYLKINNVKSSYYNRLNQHKYKKNPFSRIWKRLFVIFKKQQKMKIKKKMLSLQPKKQVINVYLQLFS